MKKSFFHPLSMWLVRPTCNIIMCMTQLIQQNIFSAIRLFFWCVIGVAAVAVFPEMESAAQAKPDLDSSKIHSMRKVLFERADSNRPIRMALASDADNKAAKLSSAQSNSEHGEFVEALTGITFVYVEGGIFRMGDIFGDGAIDEKHVRPIIVNDFYMSKFEVTVGQFRQFVVDAGYETDAEKNGSAYAWNGEKWVKGSGISWKNPGFQQTDQHPAVCLSWNDALNFTNWLTAKTGSEFKLPTEAEWEYAARSGGKDEKWAGTSNIELLREYGWTSENSNGVAHPVGMKRPNGLGLFDMSGNAWELVDIPTRKEPQSSSSNGQHSSARKIFKIIRGGSWGNPQQQARTMERGIIAPDSNYGSGFRLCTKKIPHTT